MFFGAQKQRKSFNKKQTKNKTKQERIAKYFILNKKKWVGEGESCKIPEGIFF